MRTSLRRPLWAAGAAATAAALVSALAVTPASAAPNNNNSEKLRAAVTLEGLTRHLDAFQDIATAAGGNRFAGTAGYDASAEYVFDQLTAAGYSPTYQEFTYDAFYERTPSQLHQTAPSATTYVNGNDFRVMSYSGSGDVTAAVTHVSGLGCDAADFAGFPAGTIALVSRGACTFRIKTANADAAGASAVLIYNNTAGVLNGTLGAEEGLSGIPSLGLSQELGVELAATTGLVMRVVTDTASEPLTTSNVLAELPGRNADNVVMAGAHLDSVTTGPGINDNGSGSAAVLETAIHLAKTKPFNTVRFGWWSAEESGLIGSNYYVDNLTEAERDQIALYLNFDMLASPNFARFIYDGDNSAFPVGTGAAAGPPGSDQIEALFEDYFASQNLPAEPTPFSGRSDYGRFIFYGIPAGGLFSGAEGIKTEEQAAKWGGTPGIAYDPCYHAACDDRSNIDEAGFETMADAVAHAVITYAQNTQPINGVQGKGNFKRPATGTGSAGGTGSGGGLHDDHDHEEHVA
jgi:Zn-dependent M28 family amino/carboxypeptidase